jgi:two-component system response regulator DesR
VTTVLVADDSEIVRGVVSFVLTRSGYRVVEAERVSQIVPAVQRESPDVALVDLATPGVSAAKVVASVRAAAPACRIVVFADRADAELSRLVATSKADAFVRKANPGMLTRHLERIAPP